MNFGRLRPGSVSGAVLSCALLSCAVPAQSLLRDIAPPASGIVGSDPADFTDLQGVALFAATTDHGRELWRSDGTIDGTRMVADLAMGRNSSDPEDLVAAGGRVFFTADVDGLGREWWVTDGTAAGTRLLLDAQPGSAGSGASDLVALGGLCVCSLRTPAAGQELWISDGTPSGTRLLVDLVPGTSGSAPSGLVGDGSFVWFNAYDAATVGRQLWRTDGTVAGTIPVSNTQGGLDPRQITAATMGRVFFAGRPADGSVGTELFVSDGTPPGTRMVADLQAGSRSSDPRSLRRLGNGVFFIADDGNVGREPWYSDGTAANTIRLGDLWQTVAAPVEVVAATDGTTVLFAAPNGTRRQTPWRTDGTVNGTRPLTDPSSSFLPDWMREPAAGLGGFVFVADGARLRDALLAFDPQRGDGYRFLGSATRPAHPAAIGSRLFFRGTGPAGQEPWVTDGTATGTRLTDDLARGDGGSDPRDLLAVGDRVVFVAEDPIARTAPFVSDGTPAGTLVLDGTGSPGSWPLDGVVGDGSRAWWTDAGFGGQGELMVSDGTVANSGLFVDLNPGPVSSQARGLHRIGGQLYLVADRGVGTGIEPLRVDPRDGSVHPLGQLAPGSSNTNSFVAGRLGTGAVFSAALIGASIRTGLWATDGTAAGTRLLRSDFLDRTSVAEITAVGNRAVFRGAEFTGGTEPWVTDGTTVGTVRLADLRVGTAGSDPREFTATAQRVFFIADPLGSRNALVVTDGTSALVDQLVVFPAFGAPSLTDLVPLSGDRVMFLADDGLSGTELWTSDGTVAGTRLAVDLWPGAASGIQRGTLARFGDTDLVVFGGSDGRDGLQLWISDGTAAGTARLGRIGDGPGVGAVEVADLTRAGSRLFFFCDDGITGLEPWVFDPAGQDVARSWRYGSSCRAGAGRRPEIAAVGLPRLGNSSFAVKQTRSAPSAPSILLAAAAPTQLILFGSCEIRIAPPWIPVGSATVDALGEAQLPLPIPLDPALSGLQLFAQWVLFDPNGGPLDLLGATDGLGIQIGR